MNSSGEVGKRRSIINIAAIVLPAILALVNIIASLVAAGPGFPLDDAWIHQTFARNFALTGLWNYQAGSSAGGSTSPLWTLLLVPGNWIKGLQPYAATYALGIMCFILVVWFGKEGVEVAGVDSKYRKILVWSWVILASTAWQLIWAAGSGMETMLYSALIMAVFFLVLSQGKGWIWIAGILTGIGVWIRPDALTLVGPVGLVLLLNNGSFRSKAISVGQFLLAAALPVAGYLLWNLAMSGDIFPNTFYAKQAEYAILLNAPLLSRLFNVFIPLFAGVNVLLLPGIIYVAWRSIRDRSYVFAAIFLWCLGFGVTYALRLPVSYQHGRYMMPVLAPLMLLGVIGTYQLLSKLVEQKSRFSWIISRAWVISIILIAGAFWVKGIGQNVQDVKAINELMVASAKWVAANTQSSDVIAVHDIGAMGYFGQRQIIDLAGLVNPEVIPIIRNEEALGRYITDGQAAYLVVLKDWYPLLETYGTEVAQFTYSANASVQTMVIRKLDR